MEISDSILEENLVKGRWAGVKNLADYVVHSRINRLFTLSESSIDLDFGDMNGIRSSFIKVDISMFGGAS